VTRIVCLYLTYTWRVCTIEQPALQGTPTIKIVLHSEENSICDRKTATILILASNTPRPKVSPLPIRFGLRLSSRFLLLRSIIVRVVRVPTTLANIRSLRISCSKTTVSTQKKKRHSRERSELVLHLAAFLSSSSQSSPSSLSSSNDALPESALASEPSYSLSSALLCSETRSSGSASNSDSVSDSASASLCREHHPRYVSGKHGRGERRRTSAPPPPRKLHPPCWKKS
jgi:hypothetical protein